MTIIVEEISTLILINDEIWGVRFYLLFGVWFGLLAVIRLKKNRFVPIFVF